VPPQPTVGESAAPPQANPYPAPSVGENAVPRQPSVGENVIPGMQNSLKITPQAAPHQPRLGAPEPATNPPPAADLHKVVSLTRQEIEGTVVGPEQAPVANVEVVFLNADNERIHESVRTDAAGAFSVKLTEGRWLVYVETASGQVDFAREIRVGDKGTPALTLVKR